MTDPTADNVRMTEALADAFNVLNRELFAGTLPAAVVMLHRHRGARGYFMPEAFKARTGEGTAHEIALNPDTFEGRTDAEVLSTLAHEMTHLWQRVFGAPSRNGYHNREWATKMKVIGLTPYNVNQPDKETGQKCSHHIKPGGAFETVASALLADGFTLTWEGYRPPALSAASANRNKTPYLCPCGNKVWGKPDLNLICGDCQSAFTPADDVL